MIPTDLTAALTRLMTPIVLLLAGLSYAKRDEAIGGWLMFYFFQTYAGLLVLLLVNIHTVVILFPSPPLLPPQNAGPLMLAVLPRLFGFIGVAIVATHLLKLRVWVWVKRLRFFLGVELVLAGISLVVDRIYFQRHSL
jgi:hypothetical protein